MTLPDSGTGSSSSSSEANTLPTAVVLICDDEPTVLRVVGSLLRKFGFSVLEASNGNDAMAVFNQQKAIDLLLTDVAMPGMNGLELTATIRKLRPELPILMITGNADDPDVIRGASEAGVELLEKPVRSALLVERVHAALDAADPDWKTRGS